MIALSPSAVSLFGAPLDASSVNALTPDRLASQGVDAARTAFEGDVTSGLGAPSPAPFSDLLTEAVGQVQQLEQQAKSAVEGLISGSGVDVHDAMIAAQKAGMGFELMLSVRNKALAAYQQVMGMQF